MIKSKNIVGKVLCVVIVLAIVFLIGYLVYVNQLTKIDLNSRECFYLFGCTASQFMDKNTEVEIYEEIGNLRKYGELLTKGSGSYLRLSFPQKKCEELLASDWLTEFEDIAEISDIEINESLDEVRIYTTREKAMDMIREYDAEINSTILKAQIFRVLSGEEPGKVRVVLKAVDKTTDTVVYEKPYYYQ